MNLNFILENERKSYIKFIKSARRAIALSMIACVLMFITQIVLSYLPLPTGTEVADAISSMIVYCGFILIPSVLLFLCFKHFFNDYRLTLPTRKSPKKPFLFICGALGLGYLTNLLISLLFSNFVEKHTIESTAAPTTIAGILIIYISDAVLPALLEEWAFRGIICKNLLPYSKSGAIVISSLLFGIMHINPSTIIFTTVTGIVLAICYEHTGSLKIPMLIHFLNNALATTITIFFNTGDSTDPILLLPFIIIISLIGMGIGAIFYYSKRGIAQKPLSLKKQNVLGYRLSLGNFMINSIFNIGILPLIALYIFFYEIVY